jgi:hypothetical protein
LRGLIEAGLQLREELRDGSTAYPISQSVGRVPWKCPSTIPGIAMRPSRSMTRVVDPT